MTVKADAQELSRLYSNIARYVQLYHGLVTKKFLAMKDLTSEYAKTREDALKTINQKHAVQKKTVQSMIKIFEELRENIEVFRKESIAKGSLAGTIKEGYKGIDRVIKRFEKQLKNFESTNDKHEKILESLAENSNYQKDHDKLRSAQVEEIIDLIKFIRAIQEDLNDLKILLIHENQDLKAISKADIEKMLRKSDKSLTDAHDEIIKRTKVYPALRAMVRNAAVGAGTAGFLALTTVVYRDTPDIPIDFTMIAGMSMLMVGLFSLVSTELSRDDLYKAVKGIDESLAQKLQATFHAS